MSARTVPLSIAALALMGVDVSGQSMTMRASATASNPYVPFVSVQKPTASTTTIQSVPTTTIQSVPVGRVNYFVPSLQFSSYFTVIPFQM
jgi:hypothetical protein